MRILQSVRMHRWNKRRALISARIANTFSSASHASNRKRIAFWSAAVLAFLIAPLAALVWSGGTPTSSGLNLNVSGSGTSTDALGQDSADNSSLSGASTDTSGNSSSTTVSNSASASVTVNGQTVAAPESGSTNQTITGDDGQVTHVNISSTNSSTSDKKSTNSTLRVSTHTNSRSKTESSQ